MVRYLWLGRVVRGLTAGSRAQVREEKIGSDLSECSASGTMRTIKILK